MVLIVSAAEYGSVLCDGIPLADIPQELQEGRVFKLHLRNNDLYRFPDSKLQGTGRDTFLLNIPISTRHLNGSVFKRRFNARLNGFVNGRLR